MRTKDDVKEAALFEATVKLVNEIDAALNKDKNTSTSNQKTSQRDDPLHVKTSFQP